MGRAATNARDESERTHVDDDSDMDDVVMDDELDEMADMGDQSGDDGDDVIEEVQNANFADAMQKILGTKVKEAENPIFDKRKLKYAEEKESKRKQAQEARRRREVRKAVMELGHVLPDEEAEDVEKTLRRIATKGVLTLFNAIAKSRRVMPRIRQHNETLKKKLKGKAKIVTADQALKVKLDQLTKNAEKAPAARKARATGWMVLDEGMVGKKETLKSWDEEDEQEKERQVGWSDSD